MSRLIVDHKLFFLFNVFEVVDFLSLFTTNFYVLVAHRAAEKMPKVTLFFFMFCHLFLLNLCPNFKIF